MGSQDILNIEILADGTIKTTTDAISGANHKSADEFMAMLGRLTGGAVSRSKRSKGHGHVHEHDHEHEHHHEGH